MPHCVASDLCSVGSATVPRHRAVGATILVVLDMAKENLRFPLGGNLRKGYGKMVREIIRLCLSLRSVNNTLPISLLASGERYPAVEALLASRFGVLTIDGTGGRLAPPVRVPAWASKWARGSFAKLRALTLTQFSTLLVLDADAIVLRNLDHLPSVPPPAFVFGWKW